MTLKQLLIIAFLATIICWLVWGAVLFQSAPDSNGAVGLIIFYLSLFLSFLGTFFLASFAWRKIFNKLSLEYKIVGTSFRQSFFLAFLLVGALFLQSHNFFTWWNIIMLLAAVTIAEFLFISLKRKI